jgi:RNA polymerase sigma-70 factor (ECF subfamily)
MITCNDARLVEDSLTGNREAFGAIVDRYRGLIAGVTYNQCGNLTQSEDLAQETFVQAALSLGRYRGEGDPFVWLYGILLNVDRKRRRRVHVWLRHMKHWLDLRPDGAAAAVVADRENSIWNMVRQLPGPQRQAIVLRFGEGMSYEQIGQVEGCPVGTAKSRVFHGLRTLRTRMQGSASAADVLVDLEIAFRAGAAWAADPDER